ncbi:gliding motility-associated C-terminal domain-containing protein [Ferruginibacter yonginensis]|uniref:Gliding motility-associated C-terminal domain-containing protein n=1 Tax=Ferruginibacter yonginensis TaxID=1310416 RepID=A0ABV8QS79_9BACT
MIKKILFSVLLTLCFVELTYAQPLTVSAVSATGRFTTCGLGLPNVTANLISSTGTTVVGGQLACTDPCGTTTIRFSITNVRWNQTPGVNWIHGLFFPTNSGFTVTAVGLPAGWAAFSGCTGANCSAGIVGGPGFYFDGTTANACCGSIASNDGNAGNNYGDAIADCDIDYAFTFDLTLCNSTLNSNQVIFKIRGTADGGTGCWNVPDNSNHTIQYQIGTIACTTPLFSPLPTATTPTTNCTTTPTNYTATLNGGCGNSNTITWWTASVGGTQVGSGSPFVYDPPGSACPAGTTLYAQCCPTGNTCATRRAFLIPGSCAATLAITGVQTTNPSCTTPTGSINGVTITGANGAVTYTLNPGGLTNTTGIFTGLNGTNYTLTATDAGGCSASTNVTFTPSTTGGPAPTVTTPVTYCQNAIAVPLTATGTNLLWYTTATGGTGSATAPTPSTATAGSTTYYVSQTVSGCESPRAAIVVNVTATPAAPTVTSPVTYCQNDVAVPLTATGTNLLWYTAATGGTGSATAPTPSTATIGSTTYYVSQTVATCESPRAAIVVNVTAPPAAPTVTTPVTYCQGATAVALTATGTNLLWYTTATGGTGSATAPTPSTTTPGSTTYYVSQTAGTCESPRASITVTINPTPAAPTVTTPVTYCQNATAVPLTATGTNLLWYTTATGGTGSATAPTPSTATAGSTTYYVSQTTGTCEGPRAAIVVNITATPAAPTVTTPVTYCQNDVAVALTATGTNLLWYTVATGGTGSATAPTPSTATIGNTNYYVSQTINGCEGPRALINVIVNAIPAAPTATTTYTYCQNTPATVLTATGTNLLWYTVATGGTGSATAPTPSTTTAGTTIYYVSQTNNNCESPRTSITVTVNATPAAPTATTPIAYCQNATAVPLAATGTNLLWYTTATGGTGSVTAPTPSTASGGSTTYYVSQTINNCEGPRAAIVVNVTATPAAPTVTTPVTYCQGNTATALTATGTNLLWYTTATGGTGSTTAPIPSTVTVGSTIYYVSQSTGTCEGPRASITVTINSTPTAPTVASPVTYCQGATAVALTATGTNLLWYTTATGGTGSATAPTPSTTTPGSTTYYVSQTTGTCEGPRASITVTINPTPAAPTVVSPIAYCQGATATALTATGTNLLWYTVATGGTGSTTAPTPSTAVGGTTTYYVSSTQGTCEGPRAAITVNVTATPAAPTVTSPISYCQGTAATPLTATGTNLLWYTAATGGTGSATAPTPSTATVGNTNFYVSQTINGCEGPRATITVTINTTPAAPTVSTPVTYCQNTTAVPLTANGTNLLWYTSATGGTGSATAPTPSTATAGTTTYYVSQTVGVCEGPRASIDVIVNATPALPTVTSTIDYCQNAPTVALSATGSNLLWYTTATGGTGSTTAPTPSSTTAGSTIYYVSQTINNCEGPRASITVNITATPAAPTVTSTLTYCQDEVATALTATGTNLLWYTTATGGTGSTTAPTPSTTTAGVTTYYVSQSVNTCEGPRSSITVTVNPTPLAPTVTSNFVYCENATAATLTATGNNLLWYTVATGGTGSATAPTPSTTTPGTTVYYVSQTNNNCEGPRASITVDVIATPLAPTVVTPVNYCPGDAATQLTATGTNLLWYTTATGGTGSATAPTPSTATPGTTTYYVSQTTTTGSCEGPRAAIVVNVNNSLSVNIGNDTTICEGASLTFAPTVNPEAAAYEWRALGVPNSTINNRILKGATVNPVNNAQYILKATLGGCSAEDTINVNVNWKPIVDAGPNTPICLNDSTLLTGIVTHTTGAITSYTWTPTDSLRTPNAISTWAYPTKSTTYKLTVVTTLATYGCDFTVSDSVKVVVQPVIRAFAGNDTIAVKGAPFQLQGSGGTRYTWSSPTATISNPFAQRPFVTLNNDANFFLKVEDAIGCSGLDSVFVKVYNGPNYYVPNAFSPNGDGQNDIFRPIPVGISNTTYFRIFNRYGELVFETNQWLKGWDGTFKGKPAIAGVYVWMVKGRDKDGKVVEMQGTVNLIR